MAGENSFIKVLDKVELAKRSLESEMAYVRRFYKDADFQAAYDAALRLEEMRWSSFFVTLKRKSFDIDHACILFSNGVIYPLDECGRI